MYAQTDQVDQAVNIASMVHDPRPRNDITSLTLKDLADSFRTGISSRSPGALNVTDEGLHVR